MTDTTTTDNTITLKAICAQLKIDPYDARVKLRSARSDAKQFPHLSKHKAGHAWAWPKNSPACPLFFMRDVMHRSARFKRLHGFN